MCEMRFYKTQKCVKSVETFVLVHLSIFSERQKKR